MFDAIARVLAFFYSLPVVGGSYGFAIILLTAAVMTLLMPLTLRATRSTIKMQEVQPKLKELQKKHKDDKATLNSELMALYSANGINPVGGCLPMVAQLPVFLVLFNVLRGLSRRVSEAPFYSISEHARSTVGGASIPGDTFDPRYLAADSDMYRDLSRVDEMSFGPFDLAAEARDVVQNDFVASLPYVLLIVFVVATSFYQQRQVSARRSGATMNPQQEMILKVLPLASGIWSFIFPAGLVLYWATSNVFRIGQQSYITRAFYGEKAKAEREAKEALAAEDTKTKPKKDSSDDSRKPASSGTGSGTSSKKSGSNGSASDPQDDGATSHDGSGKNGSGAAAEREAAWARRREQKARAQATTKNRSEQSSRVTPKGTKPGAKKKRKR